MDAHPPVSYGRIVVPLDGTPFGEAVLPHVVSLAGRYGAAVTLVRAYSRPAMVTAAMLASRMPGAGPPVDATPYVEAERGEAESYLELVAARLRAQGLTVDCDEEPAAAGQGIVAAARRVRADLIAMSTHARGGLGRLFAGGVADHVLGHAPCPVFLLRGTEE